jgi:hypothetical protein
MLPDSFANPMHRVRLRRALGLIPRGHLASQLSAVDSRHSSVYRMRPRAAKAGYCQRVADPEKFQLFPV